MSLGVITAYVALGANIGNARASVQQAMEQLGQVRETRCVCHSSLYRTAPWQAEGPDFINAVTRLETSLSAQDLMQELHAIEVRAGRERPFRNAPRTLDLDLLLYGDACIDTPTLVVPHPRMWERAFVLVPLAEIAPERVSAAALVAVADQAIERLA